MIPLVHLNCHILYFHICLLRAGYLHVLQRTKVFTNIEKVTVTFLCKRLLVCKYKPKGEYIVRNQNKTFHVYNHVKTLEPVQTGFHMLC